MNALGRIAAYGGTEQVPTLRLATLPASGWEEERRARWHAERIERERAEARLTVGTGRGHRLRADRRAASQEGPERGPE